MRCGVCGATIAENRAGRVIHVEEPPKGAPEHDAVSDAPGAFEARMVARRSLREALADLLQHHATICPASECVFVQNGRRALKEG